MKISALLFFLITILRVSAVQTEIVYLSGKGSDDAQTWEFFCTAGRNSGVWTTIPVPSCWEVQGFGTYDYGVEFLPSARLPKRPPPPEEQGLYRREFTVPTEWRGQAVRIVFDGVLTDTEVKINGRLAGAVHQGGFYRFYYDISDQLNYGSANILEVTVSKRSANSSVNDAERYADYWNFGGIFRPVWLEVRPTTAIERVAIDARADGSFAANVFLTGRPADGELTLQLENLAGVPFGPAVTMPLSAAADQTTLWAQFFKPDLWSAETPHLYQARFSLRINGREVHEITERFGFRTFELRPGDGLYLNGQKIRLKGVNRGSLDPDKGRTLSSRLMLQDVMLMKAANINAVRCSHYPPDAAFLDFCDEAGLYVLNELGGWHGHYDPATGKKLVAEMVARDVNHPSVIGWDNGNEGGSNAELDAEFDRLDPQQRPVLHPWEPSFRGLNTQHYREYDETKKFAAGPDVFLPTEFLHGLFDGGSGAGLDDYWKILGEAPRAAGGFLWAWSEEAVVRSDLDGRIDANRDLGPDGLVGPHGEKSGSYNAVRDIWSPVQIDLAALPADFTGELAVRNRYDFLNLNTVTFEWRLMKFAPPGALLFHRTMLAFGRLAGPDIGARADGKINLALPADWRAGDVLYLTAINARQQEVGSWAWRWQSGAAAIGTAFELQDPVKIEESATQITVTVGRNTVHFDRATGRLSSLARDDHPVSLGNGPRLVAYRRTKRVLEPVASPFGRLISLSAEKPGNTAVITARYDSGVRETRWTVQPDGDVRLDYSFDGPGVVDLLGIDFDYPEEKMKSKEWFGGGPYRVWQNRLKGALLARWDTPYNDPIPGVNWDGPEFKGWFSQWEWMAFTSTEGRFAMLNDGGHSFVGAYAPRDGKNNPVIVLPRLGLGAYQVIPAIGTKQSEPSNLGPQGQPHTITGPVRGSLLIRLLDQP